MSGATEGGVVEAARDSGAAAARRSARSDFLRALRRSPTFLTGAFILGFWIAIALIGPQIVPFDPFEGDLTNVKSPPSAEHWFGTDRIGRDVFSRVIVGARDILYVAPFATLLATIGGTIIGLLAGYLGGIVDDVLMRIVEAFLAIPVVMVGLLALVALGPSTATVIAVIGIVFTPIIARTVRAAVLSERSLDYVAAAQLRNESLLYMMFGEILPNVAAPIMVEFTVRLGYAIFTIATLSFLGFGIQPPAPDWGLQIFESYGLISADIWWPSLFPALAIASLVISVNLTADGIAGALGS
jgi:peptide/nickel transport system permease protein